MSGFKIGDRVICIDGFVTLTIDKEYVVTDVDSNLFINVLNDLGFVSLYRSNRFESVQEYRSSVINNILE